MLAKLDDLKAILDISGSGSDAALTIALTAAGALIEQYCRREFIGTEEGRTELFDGDSFDLLVECWPIVSVESLKLASDGDFEAPESLVEGDDFVVVAERGRITRLPVGLRWPNWPRGIQLVYVGGYADPEAESPPEGLAALPTQVVSAALLQAVEIYQRRKEPGTKIDYSGGPQVSAGTAPPIRLLPIVEQLLAGERRI